MFWGEPPERRPPPPPDPRPEELGGRFRAPWAVVASFVDRRFRCHHCGTEGVEHRDTDQVPGPVRHRYGTDTLLLPFCPACGLDRDQRRRVAVDLVRAVDDDEVAWVDRTPLSALHCPVRGCGRPWHRLGTTPPFPIVADPQPDGGDRRWHPCPWCVAEDLDAATAAHLCTTSAVAALQRWERELGATS